MRSFAKKQKTCALLARGFPLASICSASNSGIKGKSHAKTRRSSYLLNTRSGASSKHGHATVASAQGLVLLPDDWELPEGLSFTAGCVDGYSTNSYAISEWQEMERAGAVFLPIWGFRQGSTIGHATNGYGWYATASPNSSNAAKMNTIGIDPSKVNLSNNGDRNSAQFIRLVMRL